MSSKAHKKQYVGNPQFMKRTSHALMVAKLNNTLIHQQVGNLQFMKRASPASLAAKLNIKTVGWQPTVYEESVTCIISCKVEYKNSRLATYSL